ncbi:MAG TPA: hypothetical protein VJ521_03890 [Acidobacteriota bacterium]|nr:hypothetical protein [Acidobacteriota bacterium]
MAIGLHLQTSQVEKEMLLRFFRPRFLIAIAILFLTILLINPEGISAGMQRSREAMLSWTVLQIFSLWWS